jgi:hypothetical protein
MKRWSVIALVSGAALVLASPCAAEAQAPGRPTPAASALAIRGGLFSPSDSGFRAVYGGTVWYGGALTRRVSRRVDTSLDVSRIAPKGRLTYTHEPTEMSLLRVVAGARYRFGEGPLTPYAGAGLGFFRFRESNVIGSVNKGGLGAQGKAGVLVRLGPRVNADLGLGYSSCQMTPAGAKIQLGGLEAGLGWAVAF